ncbi:MAG TPA: GapA-binding peptide SR1P [Pseudogracilibacillus sp.]|nr:GapA-binding peptide SR1P [Pseudogracilibacillus sp.]
MGIIICQQCQEVMHYYEEVKVTKLYGKCAGCQSDK